MRCQTEEEMVLMVFLVELIMGTKIMDMVVFLETNISNISNLLNEMSAHYKGESLEQ